MCASYPADSFTLLHDGGEGRMRPVFISAFSDEMNQYLDDKIAAGFQERSLCGQLKAFDRFCADTGNGTQTFTNIQIETYEERKASSDNLYQTSKLSAEEIRRKLQIANPFGKRKQDDEFVISSDKDNGQITHEVRNEPKPKKSIFGNRKEKEKEDDDGYGNITIG